MATNKHIEISWYIFYYKMKFNKILNNRKNKNNKNYKQLLCIKKM